MPWSLQKTSSKSHNNAAKHMSTTYKLLRQAINILK